MDTSVCLPITYLPDAFPRVHTWNIAFCDNAEPQIAQHLEEEETHKQCMEKWGKRIALTRIRSEFAPFTR
jgi:hypothetical protein